MKFTPWNEPLRLDPCLPIKEPPCKECKWFQPRQISYYDPVKKKIILDSVRLCWNENMHMDFSCYEEG